MFTNVSLVVIRGVWVARRKRCPGRAYQWTENVSFALGANV